MKVTGLGGGMKRGSGRGRRLDLDNFPLSSCPASLSASWLSETMRQGNSKIIPGMTADNVKTNITVEWQQE